MHPVWFHLGPVPVGARGVILGLGFVLGLVLLATLARRDGLPAGRLIKAAVLIALGALVGARLGFVLTHWANYGPRPLAMLMWWDGGSSSWGAAAGGLLAGALGLARLPAARTADLFAPVLVLGAYFGRLGSVAAAGAAGHLRPDGAAPHLKSVFLLSTPIYLALGLLVLFALTLWLLRYRSFYGQVFWAGALGWAGLRFLVEPWRPDVGPGPDWFHPLTLTQVWSLALAGLAVMMLFILRRRGAPGRQATRGRRERRKGD